jgi:hypothetical protein
MHWQDYLYAMCVFGISLCMAREEEEEAGSGSFRLYLLLDKVYLIL